MRDFSPTALLAESLGAAGDENGDRFGVDLADLVAAIIALGGGEIGGATIGLARLRRRRDF